MDTETRDRQTHREKEPCSEVMQTFRDAPKYEAHTDTHRTVSFKQAASLRSFSLVIRPGAGVTPVLGPTQLVPKVMTYSGSHTPCAGHQVGIMFEEPSLELYFTPLVVF